MLQHLSSRPPTTRAPPSKPEAPPKLQLLLRRARPGLLSAPPPFDYPEPFSFLLLGEVGERTLVPSEASAFGHLTA